MSHSRRVRGDSTVRPSKSRDASEEDNYAVDSSDLSDYPRNLPVPAGATPHLPVLTKKTHNSHVVDQNPDGSQTPDSPYDGDVEAAQALSSFGQQLKTREDLIKFAHALPPPKVITTAPETSTVTAEEIQEYVRKSLTKPAPQRKVSVYADGVYDMLHFGHSLQLRQAKLSFPDVELIVGVMSDEECEFHKNAPCMTLWERMESVRNIKWVDRVIVGPWVITPEFIEQEKIDYVAHDDAPYVATGMEDVYAYVKSQGMFIPTRRTDSVSTSDLLARVVRSYRQGQWDTKFDKIGMSELRSQPASLGDSASVKGGNGSVVEAAEAD